MTLLALELLEATGVLSENIQRDANVLFLYSQWFAQFEQGCDVGTEEANETLVRGLTVSQDLGLQHFPALNNI